MGTVVARTAVTKRNIEKFIVVKVSDVHNVFADSQAPFVPPNIVFRWQIRLFSFQREVKSPRNMIWRIGITAEV
jgi:hypothetical protein